MHRRDEFDDPDIAGAMSSIFKAMDQRDRIKPRKPFWAMAVFMGLAAFLGSVLWYSYPREKANQEMMAVPIIYADAGPIKEVPKDAGGMNIPHRDSTVFDTMRAANAENKIENLLSDREEPMTRDQVFAGLKTDIKKAEIKIEGKTVMTIGGEKSSDEVKMSDVAEPEVVAVLDTKPVAPDMPVPAAKPDQRAAIIANNTEPAAGVQTYVSDKPVIQTGGSYYVQFASLRSRSDAERAWKTLQNEFAFLNPLSLRVQEANLGDRGVYYRVQAGPVTEASARNICMNMEAKKPGGCLVIKP